MTYDMLLKAVWGPNGSSDNQILRVNMANIRRKIEQNPAEPQFILRRSAWATGWWKATEPQWLAGLRTAAANRNIFSRFFKILWKRHTLSGSAGRLSNRKDL